MKIIHCSDIHLGASMRTHLNLQQALLRQDELLATFASMIDYAKRNKVDAIIIAGDLLDTDYATQKTRNVLLNLISNAREVDFYYLCGNHDENALLNLQDPPKNLKVFGYSWTQYNLSEDIILSGAILSNNNKSLYDGLKLDKDKFNIVVLHGGDVYGADCNTPDTVNIDMLRNKNIDYLALGHLHSFKTDKLDSRGIFAYSGCLEGRGFDECGEKGFILLDIVDKNLKFSFIPFAKRKLYEIEVDITNIKNSYELQQVLNEKTALIGEENFVRIVFNGYFDEKSQKYFNLALEPLKNKFYYIQFKDKSKPKLDLSKFENEISLAGEFVRSVRKSDLSKEEQERVIILGLRVLNGEEVEG